MTTRQRFSIRRFFREMRNEWRLAEKRAFDRSVTAEIERRRDQIARWRAEENEARRER